MILLLCTLCAMARSEWIHQYGDDTDDMIYIPGDAYMLQSSPGAGQLHIQAPKTHTNYLIGVHEYEFGTGYRSPINVIYRDGPTGHISWYYTDETWKVSILGGPDPNCTYDFDIPPVPDKKNEYHWVVLLAGGGIADAEIFYLKCNEKVVFKLNKIISGCNFRSWSLKTEIQEFENYAFGGWELLYMKGLQVRFESVHRVNACAKGGSKLDTKGIMAVKQLTTGKDCVNTCWQLRDAGCYKAWINLRENACYLVNRDGGEWTEADDYWKPVGKRNFEPDVVVDMDCFELQDMPCWRRDVTIMSEWLILPFSTRRESFNMSDCLWGHSMYSSLIKPDSLLLTSPLGFCRRFNGANLDYFSYSAMRHFPGVYMTEQQCLDWENNEEINTEFEFGVGLEGKILYIENYYLFHSCREICEEREGCSGWMALNDIQKCYMYTGPVTRKEYPNGISGIKHQLLDLVSIINCDTCGPDTVIIKPVAHNLDMISSSDRVRQYPLNLYLNVSSNPRHLFAYESKDDKITLLFKLEFYTRTMPTYDWDIRITGCDSGCDDTACEFKYNNANSPGKYDEGDQKYFVIEPEFVSLSEDYFKLQLSYKKDDESYSVMYNSKDTNLIKKCKLDFKFGKVKWNGVQFKSFLPEDMYKVGTGSSSTPEVAGVDETKPFTTLTEPASSPKFDTW